MADIPNYSPAEFAAFARRHGLTGLAPEHLRRMAELADKVAEIGRLLPRMARKDHEPAHVLRVPLK